jgi:hypothetical protein
VDPAIRTTQTRKSALETTMSAFPPIATKLRTSREVRFRAKSGFMQRSKLIGALGMLGSQYAGERAAAALQVERLRARLGKQLE